MEDPFTNREITEMFGDLKQGIARIEAQTTKHNGRMTRIEEWKAYITGGVAVLVITILPILTWALIALVKIPEQINDAVDNALAQYEIRADN